MGSQYVRICAKIPEDPAKQFKILCRKRGILIRVAIEIMIRLFLTDEDFQKKVLREIMHEREKTLFGTE